jgi:GNAT superfamily N-acetyltransferase
MGWSTTDLDFRFYAESCYYLDNLCVDFRYQRLGIGHALLEPSLENARQAGLPAQTEAGPMGVGLYRKLGFKQIGIWKVKLVNSEQSEMELPVMRKEIS